MTTPFETSSDGASRPDRHPLTSSTHTQNPWRAQVLGHGLPPSSSQEICSVLQSSGCGGVDRHAGAMAPDQPASDAADRGAHPTEAAGSARTGPQPSPSPGMGVACPKSSLAFCERAFWDTRCAVDLETFSAAAISRADSPADARASMRSTMPSAWRYTSRSCSCSSRSAASIFRSASTFRMVFTSYPTPFASLKRSRTSP